MLVTCENCNAKFKLDDSLVKDSGSKVRCSKCRHVFTAYKPSASGEDLVPEQDLDNDISEESAESEEASLDFDLFDMDEGSDDEELSLEEFGLEDEPSFDTKSGISDDAVSEDEITAADLGFEDDLEEDVPSEVGDGLAEGEESGEELSMEDLALDESTDQEATATAEGAEVEMSLEGLSLEEDGPGEEIPAEASQESEQDLSFEELSFDEDRSEDGSLEESQTEEETVEVADLSVPDDVPLASVEDGDELTEEVREETPPVPPRVDTTERKRVSTPLLVILIVALAAGGGYLGYTLLKGGDVRIPFLESLTGADTSDMVDPGNIHITLLEDAIKGEFVDNKTAGRVFVIKGKVRNDYPDMRNFVQVKGILYHKNGDVAREETVFCGNMLSATELQTLGKGPVKRELNNRFGDNKSNFRVPRGKALPFMLAFFDIPQDLGEFSVEVVGSATGSGQ
jgi:predicted Zn finger-like uncharacterized protein